MIRSGKIVVPTDFTEQSSEALRRACVLAKKFDAEVHLVHVIDPSLYFETDMISIMPLDEISEAQHEGAKKRLDEQAATVDCPVITHLEDAVTEAARTISIFAGKMDADLIVIGRHGRQGMLEHMLLGSTVERVVRYAPCSVLVAMPHGLVGAAEAE
ncbi:Nucleotide-binding universal stress protein, UspA family [Mariprofundus ferrinatatus]|uniref:Universal stress protein n=1 Tax=Mariprofundus ferrinatatus TaxID=1921087 RepID=A0A2K8L9Y9_9PROT|nr:universal stress protein [Mariprofundus ferrinatatus]ATX83069.1 Nucleotide-binding universal stress protein, UspA family [Mariprofundus ferrinatatus]